MHNGLSAKSHSRPLTASRRTTFYRYVSRNILNANEVMLSMSRFLTFCASIKDSRTIGGWCFARARRSAVGKLNIFALSTG